MPAAKKIKIALAESGLNQADLCRILDIKSSTMSKKLSNDNMLYNDVEKIADILDYDIIWQKRRNTSEMQQINNSGIMNIGIQNNQK